MPLPEFDTLEAVPETFRSEYELRDGKARPKVGDPGKAAIAAEREARRLADEARTAAEALAAKEKKRADDLELAQQAAAANIPADQLEKWKLERETAVAAEQAKTREALQKLERFEIERQFRDVAAQPDVKVFMERLDADNLAIMTRKLGLENGKLVVLGADGKATTDDPKAHIIGLKKDRPYLFRGEGADGSGSEPSVDGGGKGAYDPIAAGKAMASEQKKNSEGNKLAFS